MTCKDLLDAVSCIGNVAANAGHCAEEFNVFAMCGVDHYETLHSKIIAEFLDPKGAHGCDERFLEALFEVIGLKFNVSTTTTVVTECVCENGRMDILIQEQRPDNRWAVVIENKIRAGEQYEQIPRYWRSLRDEFLADQIAVVFLTLDGHESKTAMDLPESIRSNNVKSVSYKNDVTEWIGRCIAISAEIPFVREALCQYRNHILKVINETHKEKFMDDIKDLCIKSSDNFRAAMRIAQAADDMRTTIIKRIVKFAKSFVPAITKNELAFSDDVTAAFGGFSIVCPELPFDMYFEFQKTGRMGMFAGLAWKDSVRKDRKRLALMMKAAKEAHWRHVNDCWADGSYLSEYKNWTDDVLFEAFRFLEQNVNGGLIGVLQNTMSGLDRHAKEFSAGSSGC